MIGVDIAEQPNYPFRCYRADALDVLEEVIEDRRTGLGEWSYLDAIHASPPCQAYSDLRHRTRGVYPDLIGPTRDLLRATGLPYIIENVEGAPLLDPVTICGSSVGLGSDGRQLRRHRLFETSFPLLVPPCAHTGPVVGVYGTGGGGQMNRGFKARGVDEARALLDTPWMTLAECAQAIPPAFTELIGLQLLTALQVAA